MEGDRRKECQQEFDRIWDRLGAGDKVFEKLKDKESQQDLDIREIKTQITHLVQSMSGLTKALWGIVISVCGVGIGFIIWFIQAKGG